MTLPDRFNNLRGRVFARSTLRDVKAPSFDIISAMQRHADPALQLDALALTFTAICQATGLDPHEHVSRAKRQLRDADAVRNPHIEAIRDYATGELK